MVDFILNLIALFSWQPPGLPWIKVIQPQLLFIPTRKYAKVSSSCKFSSGYKAFLQIEQPFQAPFLTNHLGNQGKVIFILFLSPRAHVILKWWLIPTLWSWNQIGSIWLTILKLFFSSWIWKQVYSAVLWSYLSFAYYFAYYWRNKESLHFWLSKVVAGL